jgi:hypothetical protein
MARRGNRTGTRAVTGLVCVLYGVFASVVPFASAGVAAVVIALGLVLAAIAQLFGSGSLLSRRILALMHVAAAAVIGLWPGIPLPVVAAVAGVVLVAAGGAEFWAGLASGGSWVALGSGAFTLVTGAVATLWADPVLMPIAVAIGWRLVLVGAGLLVDVWYPAGLLGARTGARRVFARVGALTTAVVLTVAAVAADQRGTVPDFYDATVAAGTHAGTLLRAAEIPNDGAVTFRLLYATTGGDDEVRPASAVLSVPAATRGAELPVVVWVHGSVGVARSCAPSLLGGGAGGPVAESRLLAAGYAVLAVDLPGLGTAGPSSYLLGVDEGRAVLDAVRAVSQVPGVRVGTTVLWGYDQGGHAVLWADEIATTYAPDVRLAGVVAVAPATDLTALFSAAISSRTAGTLGTDLLLTYPARYPDIRLAGYTGASSALVDEIGAHCDGARGLVGEAWAQTSGFDQAWTMPADSALAERLAQNTPSEPFAAEVLVVQGAADTEVPAVVQDDWVQGQCSAGTGVEYRKLAGVDHDGVIGAGSAAVAGTLTWIGDRFAGRAPTGLCGR